MKLQTGHEIEFQIGQIVYLKTDEQQTERMVTVLSLKANNSVTYCLSLGATESWHFGIEISSEKDTLKAVK